MPFGPAVASVHVSSGACMPHRVRQTGRKVQNTCFASFQWWNVFLFCETSKWAVFLDFVCCSFVFWLGVCLDFPFDSKNCHETSVSLENIFEKIQKKFEMVCGSGIAGKAQKCAAAANE